MDLQLHHKHVVVTGASKGIGLAIVRSFRAEGAVVSAISRTLTPELEATGAAFFSADLSTKDGPAAAIAAVLAVRPEVDVLVNNAGGGTVMLDMLADPLEGDDDAWTATIGLNFLSSLRTTRAALPALVETRGAIVNIASEAARRPGIAPLPYATAKAALVAFSRGLAEKVGPLGVKVNTVSPSATRTPLLMAEENGLGTLMAQATGVDRDTLLREFPAQAGLLTSDYIEPEEIAQAVLLLASPTLPSAMGANWAVDAGSVKAV